MGRREWNVTLVFNENTRGARTEGNFEFDGGWTQCEWLADCCRAPEIKWAGVHSGDSVGT